MIYTLTNRNGGFAIIEKAHYEAWAQSPQEAIENYPELKENLRRQTLDRGYNYADFTPNKIQP